DALRLEIARYDRVHVGGAGADSSISLDMHTLPRLETLPVLAADNHLVEIIEIAAIEGDWHAELLAEALRLAHPALHLLLMVERNLIDQVVGIGLEICDLDAFREFVPMRIAHGLGQLVRFILPGDEDKPQLRHD